MQRTREQTAAAILTDNQCDALLADAVAGPPFLGWDRRQDDRWDKRRVVHLFLGDPRTDARFIVRSRDLSVHGIGLFHSEETRRGTPVRVAMLTLDGRRVERTGCVVSCARRPDGVYSLGVRFDQGVDASDFIPRRHARAA